MLPEWEPKVTFSPQCAWCELNDGCQKAWLKLYRSNYIKCPEWRSSKKWWEPSTGSLGYVKEELTNNRAAYTKSELQEAEATYKRL